MIKFEYSVDGSGDVKIFRLETNDQDELLETVLIMDQPATFIHGDSEEWAKAEVAHLEEGEANKGLEVPEQPLAPEDLELGPADHLLNSEA